MNDRQVFYALLRAYFEQPTQETRAEWVEKYNTAIDKEVQHVRWMLAVFFAMGFGLGFMLMTKV